MGVTVGREMDALVAEKVMGWVWLPDRTLGPGPGPGPGVVFLFSPARVAMMLERHVIENRVSGPVDEPTPANVPRYSTDIAAAWEVVEKLRASGWLVRVQEMPDGQPWLGPDDMDPQPKMFARAHCSLTWMLRETPDGVRRYIHEHPFALGSSAAEAICIAALKAVGVEVPA